MLTVEQVLKSLLTAEIELQTEEKNVLDSAGFFLAKAVEATVALPPFSQSAMDGYAFRWEDAGLETFRQVALLRAGDKGMDVFLEKGECARVFTGAAVPANAGFVEMQEKVRAEGDQIFLLNSELKPGQHIRQTGEQFQKGEALFKAGTEITPATAALLLSLGIEKTQVFVKPALTIIATGNEFAQRQEELEQGKIFESNSGMLAMLFHRQGYKVSIHSCGESKEELISKIEEKEADTDVFVLTGGVSVGDFDFTPAALQKAGFEAVFHKIAQKPGKPMLFAQKQGKFAFGLPGNPRSAFVNACFYLLPFLKRCSGGIVPETGSFNLLPLRHDYTLKGNLDQILSAEFLEGGLEIQQMQASHMMLSLANAQALVWLSCNQLLHPKGSLVPAIFLK